MRSSIAAADRLLALASSWRAAGFAQADAAVKGLCLLTDYPSQTVRAGEVATIRFKLQNAGLPPEPVALSLAGVPAGWKVDILGGGQPVAAAMPGINEDVEPAASRRRAEGRQARLAEDRAAAPRARSPRRSTCRSP